MGAVNPNRTKTIAGLKNPKCFAQSLGGCCIKINLEHYVSEGILKLIYGRFGQESEFVPVQNLAFQPKNVLEERGTGSLTAHILCVVHNGLLSKFDSVGKAMFVAMDALNERASDATRPQVACTIDGDGLERWMLKTLSGGLYSGNFPLPDGVSFKKVCPPDHWLDILFNEAPFPPGLGLYYVLGEPDERIMIDPQIFKPGAVVSDDGRILGLRLFLFGFHFVLLMEAASFREETQYRPSGFMDIGTGARIGFDWKRGAQDQDVVVSSSTCPPSHWIRTQ